jgi:hypothetical protein
MIRATGAGVISCDGVFFNKLSDHFALQSPTSTAVLEDFFNWHWPEPRINNNVIYNSPARAFDYASSKIANCLGAPKESSKITKWFVLRARVALDWHPKPAQIQQLGRIADIAVRSASQWYRRYRRLLEAKKVRLLIAEEAAYGGWLACLVKAAKDLHIPVAEYQHGIVSSGHDAYNLSQLLVDSDEFRKYLPDYFLSYGDWWNQQFNLPCHKRSIGNPHRSQMGFPTLPDLTEKRNILILGEGRETQTHLSFAELLQSLVAVDFRVVFRPHPQERHKFEPGGEIDNSKGVPIDLNPDIYSSFAHAHTIVAELSTGLFEAVGLVPQILVWETEKSKFGLPNHPFQSVSDAQDAAVAVLRGVEAGEQEASADAIWRPNWQENFQLFLIETGVTTERRVL